MRTSDDTVLRRVQDELVQQACHPVRASMTGFGAKGRTTERLWSTWTYTRLWTFYQIGPREFFRMLKTIPKSRRSPVIGAVCIAEGATLGAPQSPHTHARRRTARSRV